MKKMFLVAVMAVFMVCAKAQEPVSFERVYKVDSIGKDIIFSKIKEHFVLKFKSPRFFSTQDRETGLLIGKAQFDFQKKGFAYSCYCGGIDFSVNIQIREGRYKVVLSDFKHAPNGMCGLGIIKTGDLVGGTMNGKKFDVPVWIDLQKRTNEIGELMLGEFDKIKFKEDNW